jgi:hypothetical protein
MADAWSVVIDLCRCVVHASVAHAAQLPAADYTKVNASAFTVLGSTPNLSEPNSRAFF